MENKSTKRNKYQCDFPRYPLPRIGGGYIAKVLVNFRRMQLSPYSVTRLWSKFRFRTLCNRRGLEIPSNARIGKGLYIGHAYNITINSEATIGENCNLHKGVTIGQENRGKRKGAPIIGNQVWVGINAIVVGRITVGDDVLIAPGAFVNVDVPSHSVVLGNPCIVKHKDNATEGYINRLV